MDQIEQNRFEYRCWGQQFGLAEERLRAIGPCSLYRESSELYLVSSIDTGYNVKIRHGLVDIKQRLQTLPSGEQWAPEAKIPFPIDADQITWILEQTLGVHPPPHQHSHYDLERLIHHLLQQLESVTVVWTQKRRFGYLVGTLVMELAEVTFNGAQMRTISIESTDPDQLWQQLKTLGLSEYENINYPRMARRVVGREYSTAMEQYIQNPKNSPTL